MLMRGGGLKSATSLSNACSIKYRKDNLKDIIISGHCTTFQGYGWVKALPQTTEESFYEGKIGNEM